MNYKLVAVDMNGTLLNSRREIAEKTVAAVQQVVEKGVVFAICTGRPVQGVKKYTRLLDLQGPIITYNGAMIVDIGRERPDRLLFEQGLGAEDARQIWRLGQSYGVTMCVWSANRLYSNRLDELTRKYSELSGMEPQLAGDIEELLPAGVTKILWYAEAAQIQRCVQTIPAALFDEVTFCTSQPIFLEFFSSRVSKAAAMAKIGEIYNIKPNEMIAIGDGLNDLSMIEYAGLGVAMGNAEPEVKACAQYITDTNDNEGVRQVLEKFILA